MVMRCTTPVLLCSTPVLPCSLKKYSSTTLYYKILLQYYPKLQTTSVLQPTIPVLPRTKKYYSVLQNTTRILLRTTNTILYTPVLPYTTMYYSNTAPVLPCISKYYSNTTPYYKYYSVYSSTTLYYKVLDSLIETTWCPHLIFTCDLQNARQTSFVQTSWCRLSRKSWAEKSNQSADTWDLICPLIHPARQAISCQPVQVRLHTREGSTVRKRLRCNFHVMTSWVPWRSHVRCFVVIPECVCLHVKVGVSTCLPNYWQAMRKPCGLLAFSESWCGIQVLWEIVALFPSSWINCVIVLQGHCLEICPWAESQSLRLGEEILKLEPGNRLVLENQAENLFLWSCVDSFRFLIRMPRCVKWHDCSPG